MSKHGSSVYLSGNDVKVVTLATATALKNLSFLSFLCFYFEYKMFGGISNFNYEILPQREHDYRNTPGLFTSGQTQYNSGFSFDYVPKIKNNDFTDESQGLISRLCNLVVIGLVFLCTLITFPISAWFVLKVSLSYILITFVYFTLRMQCLLLCEP